MPENHIRVISATKRSLCETIKKEQGPRVFNCGEEGVSHKKCLVSMFLSVKALSHIQPLIRKCFPPTKQQNGTSASQQYGWEHTQDGQPENHGPSQGEKPSHSLEKTHFQLPTAGFTPSLSHHLCHYLPTFTSSFCQNKNLPLMNQIQGYCHQHRYCGWIVGSWQLDNYELVIGQLTHSGW